MTTFQKFLRNLLILIDEAANTLTGGSPEETISSRAAKANIAGKTWGCVLCKFLDLFDKGHCNNALLPAQAGVNAIIPNEDTPAVQAAINEAYPKGTSITE